MKNILTYLLLANCLNQFNAQLTNNQVYNFEVGDVFQITFSAGFPGPHPLITDTISSKFYSVGFDSIIYTIDRLVYYAPANFGDPASYNYSVETLIITDLSSPASHFTYTTCLPETDTAFVGICSEYIERLQSNYDTSCFEPSTWYSDLYDGLGGPYYYCYDPTISGTGNEWFSKTLTYYNTSQQGECGTLISFLDLTEHDFKNLQIFPNPVSEGKFEIKLNYLSEESEVYIFNAYGEIVLKQPLTGSSNTIDCANFNNGFHLIEIHSASKLISREKLIVIK